MNEESKTCSIGVRITGPMKSLLDRYLSMDAHVSYGDLIRDALREKIKREAPDLYNELFEPTPHLERQGRPKTTLEVEEGGRR